MAAGLSRPANRLQITAASNMPLIAPGQAVAIQNVAMPRNARALRAPLNSAISQSRCQERFPGALASSSPLATERMLRSASTALRNSTLQRARL
ncbi:hypothetical protein D9M73_220460 [compost metagenome]